MTKKIFAIGGGLTLFFLIIGGLVGVGGVKIVKDVLHGQLGYKAGIFGKWLINKNYVVLFQNNTELRPTGGFVGSFAKVKFGETGLERIEVQDIYEPDGKITGHVEPPYPIQEAFGQGWWKLRDANWDVDFGVAASHSAWFFEQGGVSPVDGIVAINQLTVSRLLKIFGPFRLATYDETVSDKNFYFLAQKYAEIDKDKRGFLGNVGARLVEEIKHIGLIKTIKLLGLIKGELEDGQVLLWTKDPGLQKEIEKLGWGGRLENNIGLYVVESNLGSNKANCCVSRSVTQEINGNNGKVTIDWKNNNEFSESKPPVFWGGDYRDYVRVLLPGDFQVQTVKAGGRELRAATDKDFEIPNSQRQGLSEDIFVIEKRGDLQIIGFWVVVRAGEGLAAEIKYSGANKNEVLVKRQPGIEDFSYKLIVDGRIVTDAIIDREQEFEIK